ncbi:MAG: GWxTD domain-containing protein, partial [bacterium]|nr:GWxTD domain-containing protein [bacterium]
MKYRNLLVIILLAIISVSMLPAKSKIKKLAPKYRIWLTAEVGYIITPTEKKVFLQLESDRERDMFIEAFWKQRDPNLNTEENEFKIEHFKRLKYIKEKFGRDTPTKAWRTERGRIHIILGEPNHIARHENQSEVYPVIVWFYQGLVKYGLPNAFHVVFFKKQGTGDYELY